MNISNNIAVKRTISLIIILLLFTSVLSYSFYEKGKDNLHKADKSYNVVYVENDPYFNYAGTFEGILKGLEFIGYLPSLDDMPYVSGQSDTYAMFSWLVAHTKSSKISFKDGDYYRLTDMSDEEKQAFIDRMNTSGEADLIIAMGTKAGKFASQNINVTPVMVFSTSDAVGAGIVASAEDSGKDNVWAHVDTKRYFRQVSVFYDLVKFKSIGVVYEDTPEGRVLASLSTLEDFAKNNGLELVERHVKEAESIEDQERYDKDLIDAYKDIANEVDAFYLTAGSRDTQKLYEYLQPFYDSNVPVFSQTGIVEVEKGALMTVYRLNYDEIGYFGSDTITKVLEGELPRKLTQEFGETPSISINLEAAKMINFNIPFDVMLISDKIFTEIKVEE